MPEGDDFATELRGDEDEPLNAKGNDWVAVIAGGVIVGVIVAGVDRWSSNDRKDHETLVEVSAEVKYLSKEVGKLTEQPYVRREEFRSGIEAVQNGIAGLDERVRGLEGRAPPVRETDRRR